MLNKESIELRGIVQRIRTHEQKKGDIDHPVTENDLSGGAIT